MTIYEEFLTTRHPYPIFLDLTKDEILSMLIKGVENNVLVYDNKSKKVSEKLLLLINSIYSNLYNSRYTHILVSEKTFHQIKKDFYNQHHNDLFEESVSGKLVMINNYYNDCLKYYNDNGYCLAPDDKNLIICLNMTDKFDNFNDTLKERVLLASY